MPPEPPNLYTARSTSSSIIFHWRLSSTGDAPITGYTMTYHLLPKGPYKQVAIPRHTTSFYLNVSASKIFSRYVIIFPIPNCLFAVTSRKVHLKIRETKMSRELVRVIQMFSIFVKFKFSFLHFYDTTFL